MLEIIIPTIWTCLAVYSMWYFTSAKQYAPLTPQEAKILWKIHQKRSGCKSKKMRKIRHKDTLVGFQCSCGYRYIKKQPIVLKYPKIQPEN
jgi:hypothetical protein